MKLFFQIFLKNLIPTKEFWIGFFTMVGIVLAMGLPLYLLGQILPREYYWTLGPAFGVEYYILIMGIKSWVEYKKAIRN